ncbi:MULTISPECIES: hypothetical protein [unclassified Maridesulfovibrio]|uniref:hypothetical protein n=1 Tax=unclassified Maridesulfovibrio TaxID=2794999 RepID=UPI003B41C2CF
MSKISKLTSMENEIHDKQKAIEKKANQLYPEGTRLQFVKPPMKKPATGRVQGVRWNWDGSLSFSVENEKTGKSRDIALRHICVGGN